VNSEPTRSARLRRLLLDIATQGGPNGAPWGWHLDEFHNRVAPEFTNEEIAAGVSQLFVAGLLELGTGSTKLLFVASEQARAPSSIGEPESLPEDVEAVWSEAMACLPNRPRAAAILLGVAAEMVIATLANLLNSKAPHKDLVSVQTSLRRNKCIEIIDQRGAVLLGMTPDQVRSTVNALRAFGSIAWQRDEAAHRDPSQIPDVAALFVTAASFPALAHAILAQVPQE
jgi:hypothetical protein